MLSALQAVIDYHQRSKHRFEAYAAGPDTLDWDDQPEAFRWFDGAEKINLPLLADSVALTFNELYRPQKNRPDRPVFDRLAMLLERSLGLAAWKQYGDARWALRCNPSSGNLHPTEAYVITAGVDGLAAGVYHYLSRDHQLELRCRLDAARLSPWLPEGALLIGLSSIHWREAWKYGERAYRYCQHDCGHAIAALGYSAAVLGCSVKRLDDWGDDDIARVLGLDRDADFDPAEREHPDAMLLLETDGEATTRPVAADLVAEIAAAGWEGQANSLSPSHLYDWPVIDEVAQACHKPRTPAVNRADPALPEPVRGACDERAMTLFRRRRSAQHFDGSTSITADRLYRMLDMTLPRPAVTPWQALPWQPRIHLLLFIHRVEGLRPGLYLLCRDRTKEGLLRDAINRREFQWQAVEDCPSHLPFYSLVFANCQRTAATLSCHQAIAADSAFSLGMLAEFDAALQEGPWQYRQLFQEAGMLGQVLYLEAEAAGVSGTGIGCYFDDPFHDLLGIEDTRLQSLYHFTVGGALVDERLATTPPYIHLQTR